MMRRWTTITLALLGVAAAVAAGCFGKEKKLLCESDSDCGEGTSCELVSGLCKPSPAQSKYLIGASGAFDCEVVNALPGMDIVEPQTPGLATVIPHDIPSRDVCNQAASSDSIASPKCSMAPAQGQRVVQTYQQTGCEITIINEPLIGEGMEGERPYYRLEFKLIDRSYDNPKNVLTFNVRKDELAAGELAIGERASAIYEERCTDADNGDTELELRSVATCGTLTISSTDNNRVRGSFDVELPAVDTFAKKSFGERCHVPRECGDGCAISDLQTAECLSGVCLPDYRDSTSPLGFCGGACEDSRDCRAFEDPNNFCLWTPGHRNGQCIRLCNPELAEAMCPDGTSCRPGTDFPEFLGQPGPARCLDDCIKTPSHLDLSPACLAERGDAGVRDAEAPRDAEPARDTGPADTGAPDAGFMSPLGQTCSTTVACPGLFFCGSRHDTTTTGYCTRPCMMDDACTTDYHGPGIATCDGQIRNIINGNRPQACAILCGLDFGGDGTCPGNMICSDQVNNATRMPPPDGALDFCIDPG